MSSAIMHQILQTIVAGVQSRPIAIEFEMAYQVSVAIDRIRFAIKHTEQFGPHTDPLQEAGLQLLDPSKDPSLLSDASRNAHEFAQARASRKLSARRRGSTVNDDCCQN